MDNLADFNDRYRRPPGKSPPKKCVPWQVDETTHIDKIVVFCDICEIYLMFPKRGGL